MLTTPPPKRCELSDLPADQCGCRIHRPDGGQIHIDPAQDGRVRTAGHTYGPSVTAGYPGRCPTCGDRYEVGEPIRPERFKTIDSGTGKWVHAECAEEA